MTMQVQRVGHVVLRVESLQVALRFYTGVLGLREVARRDFGEGPMAFLSSGSAHHDLALVETGKRNAPGALHHVALKVGDDLNELSRVKEELTRSGVTVHTALDHHVSQGLYVSDPDGNLLELYVDADPTIWRDDPSRVANSDPLSV
jgi:catechol 2,3-dioxygenase